tara:strand:- start:529 stop:684 length:156 start_codon:yes stop_codon:yes gene_type:complete
MEQTIFKILTHNEEILRDLIEKQKKQSKILDGIINTTNNLKDDINQIRKEI